jgi:hypothetical protein
LRSTLILFFLLASGGALLAQQAPAPPLPAEQQPPLNVDRDPVPSPPPSVAAPATTAPAAEQPGQVARGKNGGYTLVRDVDEVVLSATVIDDHGHLVTGLKTDDFHVFEDGKPQTITALQEQDIPVSIGLLIDNSGSMRTKRQAVNEAALDMVRASNPQDETFVVNFADEAYIDQDFTSDINRLRDGLSHIDSKGGTALYDAVIASADYMSKNAKRAKEVLLIITDGEDNASGTNLEETVRRIQDLQGPVVYSLTIWAAADASRIAPGARCSSSRMRQADWPFSPRILARWMRSRRRWRAISGTSTPSATTPPSQQAWADIAWCTLTPRRRATAR